MRAVSYREQREAKYRVKMARKARRELSKQLLDEILADPVKRKELMVRCIMATQAREGIETTREQAERAYEAVTRGNTTAR
jgi:hypothetical protein